MSRVSIAMLLFVVLVMTQTLSAAQVAESSGATLTVLRQDWGNPCRKTAVQGGPLVLGTQTYARGIGTHSNSELTLMAPPGSIRFTASVGVDANTDTAGGKGSVIFKVRQGDKTLFTSPILRSGQAGVPVDIAITPKVELHLLVSDGGDDISFDQADWAEAKIQVGDKTLYLDELPWLDQRATQSKAKPTAPTLTLPDSWQAAVADPAGVPLWRRTDAANGKPGGEWGRRQQVTLAAILATPPEEVAKGLNKGSEGNMYLGLGKFLDAVSRFAIQPEASPQVVAYRRQLLDIILKAQSPDGYIGGWPGVLPLAKAGQWEVHELTYLIYALCTDARLHQDQQSRAAAEKAGKYLLNNLKPLREHCAQGLIGLDQCLVALYQLTGDASWQDALLTRVAPTRWLPYGRAPNDHFYEHLSLCVGQMDYCQKKPSPELLKHGLALVEYLGPGGGLLVTGSSSDHEKASTTQASGVIVETCATAYLVRVLGRTFELTGDLRCHDILERTIPNALFAAQTQDGKIIRYFTRHEGARDPNGPYLCCRMNYRRTISELGEYVVYSGRQGVAIAQYTPGRWTQTLASGTKAMVEIDTAYPLDSGITIKLSTEKPETYALRLRIPAWCTQARLSIDGQAFSGELKPGTWAVIERAWNGPQTLRLDLPLTWRWVAGRGQQTGKAALLCGPLLYHQDPARSKPAAVGTAATENNLRREADGSILLPANFVFVPYADDNGRNLWFPFEGAADELYR